MTRRQRKTWLVLLLFVHLLVHPMLHDFSLSAAGSQVTEDNGSRARKMDDCAFCRDGSVFRGIGPVLLVEWQPVLVQLVPPIVFATVTSFASTAESPRAPPVF